MKRLMTAIGLLAFAFSLIFFVPEYVFIAAAFGMGALCYREYSALVVGHGIRNPGWLGLAGGLLVILCPHSSPAGAGLLLPAITVLAVVSFIAALRFSDLSAMLPQVSAVILGVLYAFAPWRFAVDLRRESVHLLFFALALNWAGDSAAYYFGRYFGRHRLAPIVSPNKSWEGAAASVAGSVLFGVLYLGHFVPALPKWEVVLMAMLGNIAGQFGDLSESALKRVAGVKDSGTLLPGHGGVLDRMDSSLFALPVVFLLYWTISKYL